ncbi:TonB-dependent receptor [Gilvimarinus polysaccharolyticus]|uniref:TonB-dependent receptor n=1 Tax=Gilvimarinus polysaccharolyticus TaxID=863921 RepID=UPI000A01103B|nr:TonB-dependent receptor [Gilvimarinus polysaccharolyticus]
MVTKHKFRRNLIASAVASCTLAGMANFAYAQNDDEMLEEVIVTGIRASLERSMDLKRDASGVVDAISAEDIGKFPDTNLAESLQRITGVSIDRRNGEGSKVTVRGLGPDFNLVTLNGRQMPGATIEDTVASGSRSFDFGNIASESVSAVEVYKTSRADVAPGGMGATINIVTPRPLDNDARASIGIKGTYDESSANAEMTPEISGIYSDTFNDGMFGIAVTGSYQERKGGSATAQIGTGWRSFPGTVVQDWSEGSVAGVDNDWGGIDFNGNHQNQPAAEDVYSTPQQMGYVFTEFERKRTNGQLTLQFAPTDDLTATLDYTYSENEIASNYNDIGGWFNFGGQSTIFSDAESPGVQTPLLYSEDMTGADLPMGVGEQAVSYENDSIGFNVEWKPIDPLTLSFDMHSSTAEAKPGNEFGNSVGIAVSAYVRDRSTVNVKGEMPVLVLDILDGAGGSSLRPEDLQVSGSYFRNSQMKQDIDQIQIDGEWEFNESLSMQFGIARTESDYESAFSNVQRESWGGLGEAGDMPSDWFTPETILDRFNGNYGDTTADEIAFLGGTNTTPLNERFSFDFHQIKDFAAANYDDGAGTGSCADGSTWYCAKAPDQINNVTETTESAYVQVNFDTEIANMPFGLNAGLRYESTEVETPATAQGYGPIKWVSANEFSMPMVGDPVAVTDSGEYDFLLPSLDMKLEVVEDVVLRASYGQSIARPSWLDVRGGTSYSDAPRINGATAGRGSPGLEPYKADNIDLSVEWYYGDASYVSAGYFTKEVENFIGTRVVTEEGPLENTPHPAMGKRYNEAVAAVGRGVEDIREYIYANYADPETAYIDGSGNIVIVGIPGEDPNTPVDITEVANSDKVVTIDGWELAVQHNFWDTGFGVIANYTIVDVDTSFDNMVLTESQFSITGVSDTANFIAFYEKHGFQARVAYNWRDSFLASGASGTGNNPIYVDEYSQVDANISYELTDNLSIFLEGLNLTEENGLNYGRSTDQVLGYYEGYARYNIGARYTF